MLRTLLQAQIGSDSYREACASARHDAESADYGRGSLGEDDSSLVPHELSAALWEAEVPLAEKIATLFEVFDEMPSGGLLMYVSHHYLTWSTEARQQFWAGVRQRLGGEDRALARPITYYLWCDWFEHGDFTEEAWEALTGPDTPKVALREVLIASGPVPWSLKVALYQRLEADVEWHSYLCRSILHSAFDVCGQIDRADAARWLERLTLATDTEHVEQLRRKLRD